MHVCIHSYVHTYTHIHEHMNTCINTCTLAITCIHANMRTCMQICTFVHAYIPSFIHPSLQPSTHSLAVASQALTPGRNGPESVPSAVMWSPSRCANRGMIHGAISNNKNTVCHDTTKTKRNGWKVVKWNAHW